LKSKAYAGYVLLKDWHHAVVLFYKEVMYIYRILGELGLDSC